MIVWASYRPMTDKNTGLSEDLIYWLQSGCKENLTKNTLPTLALRGINCK